MSLVWFEGFDHYKSSSSASNLNTGGWDIITNGAGNTSPTTRWGTGKWGAIGAGSYSLPSALGELIIGFAVHKTTGNTQSSQLLQMYDSTGTAQLFIGSDENSRFCVRRGTSAGTVIATSTTILRLDTWYYIELRVKVDDSVGTIDFRINGVSEATASNIDTKSSSNANIQLITGQGSAFYDDFYVVDPTVGGAPWNTFLGDVRVSTIDATSDDSVQFTPLSGSNRSNIDDASTNDDTDYNSSTTTGHIDTFNITDLTGTPTVYGVAVVVCARKDNSANKSIKTKLVSGGTTNTGSAVPIGPNYMMARTQFETDPNTSAQWTYTNFNAVKAGYEAV